MADAWGEFFDRNRSLAKRTEAEIMSLRSVARKFKALGVRQNPLTFLWSARMREYGVNGEALFLGPAPAEKLRELIKAKGEENRAKRIAAKLEREASKAAHKQELARVKEALKPMGASALRAKRGGSTWRCKFRHKGIREPVDLEAPTGDALIEALRRIRAGR